MAQVGTIAAMGRGGRTMSGVALRKTDRAERLAPHSKPNSRPKYEEQILLSHSPGVRGACGAGRLLPTRLVLLASLFR